MAEMDKKELDALVYLLDDTDEDIVKNVTEKILSMGEQVIPFLEDEWSHSQNKLQSERIESIIHQIQFRSIQDDLQEWVESPEQDLFNGFYILSRIRYPHISKQELDNAINKIKLDTWLEMRSDMSSLEKVRVLNHIFYQVHGFTGNTTNYHDPQNSFLNTVLETKKGNPISLSIIYSIIAQRLNIPIFGVNLPQHFILAYIDDNRLEIPQNPMVNHKPSYKMPGEILFYINAFNKGLVFSRQNIEMFLNQLKIEQDDSFFKPCSNDEILKRVIRNLYFAYSQQKDNQQMLAELRALMTILGGSIDPENGNMDGEADEEDDDDNGF